MIPKFRAWHKPMQRMSKVFAISFERQKVKIRDLTVLFDDIVKAVSYKCTQEESKKYPQFRWVALEEL